MMIKHAISYVFLGLGIAALGGCPIYSNDGRWDRVCNGGACYRCPDSYTSDACTPYTCYDASDCPTGMACSTDHACRESASPLPPVSSSSCSKPSDCSSGTNCGVDRQCHTGDCSASGCPSSYVCKLSNGAPACELIGAAVGITSTCSGDKDCTTAGAKCLTGSCVAPSDQCADATQCTAGSACVGGACTPSCSATKACPTGYACDDAKGVCTATATTCTRTSTSSCTNSTICVDEHCVTPCGPNGTCAAGLVCVDGGCTPNEKPAFDCATEGVQDKCQAGSICLRHSCYIACDTQVADSCKNADKFNVCKSVTTSSGAHSVCSSATNLGAECDPTTSKGCADSLVCIDGFCR